jgi:hypothetical protein
MEGFEARELAKFPISRATVRIINNSQELNRILTITSSASEVYQFHLNSIYFEPSNPLAFHKAILVPRLNAITKII